MAPLVAFMRSATAMDQEASTRNSTRLATRLTRTLRCRSDLLDGEGQALALLGAALLERRGGAEGGIEGDVIGLVVGRARLDIAAVLALGLGERAPAGMLAGQLVEGCVQPARAEGLAGLDLLPALPPLGVGVREHVLRHGLRRSLLLLSRGPRPRALSFFFLRLGFLRLVLLDRPRWAPI